MKTFARASFFSLVALLLPLFAQQVNSTVEDEGVSCSVTLPTSFTTANTNLPDPFTKLNGQRMTTKEEWTCRRQEIRKLIERTVYGTKSPKPSSVTGTVTRNGNSGSITVNVSEGGKTASFTASITFPTTGTAPFPAVIGYGTSNSDATVRGEGVATINYNAYNVGAEGTGRASKSGAYYTIYGSNSKTGLLAAWAWGVSRIIDVIEQSDGTILKANAIGVTGCSRFGKGSFAAGVFDQRIALTMPVESGTAGVPALRSVPGEGAQSLTSAYGEQPWFGDDFGSFTSSPNNLPIDMHEAVAMVAPRGLFIMDNPHIANLGPKSAHLSAVAGSRVYEALGYGGNITYHSNVQDGSHCAWRNEWAQPLKDNIAKFLKGGTTTGGTPTINPRSGTTGNTGLINWTTPNLSGSIAPPQSSSSSVVASSSSSRVPSSSSVTPSSSSVRSSSSARSSSSSVRSSSSVTPSSSSGEVTPIVNKLPLTHFSARMLNGKTLFIETSSPTEVQIYDLGGNKVAEFNVVNTSQAVSLSLPSGVYFAKAHGMQSIRFIKK